MIKIQHLSKKYGNKRVLDDLNLILEPYVIYGILGHNGCGKSTLFKSIMGLVTMDEGKILFEGVELDREARKHIGYMPEQKSLLGDLYLKDQLYLLGKLKGMTEEQIEEQSQSLISQFGLSSHQHKRIRSLSKGQQQKTQLMIALLNDPQILILDEPLNGLDIESVDFFINVLKEFTLKGKSILISSHQMEFMDALCTHLLVLKEGKTLYQGPTLNLQEQFGYTLQLNANMAKYLVSSDYEIKGQRVQMHFTSKTHVLKQVQSLLKEKDLEFIKLSSKSISDILKEQ